MNCKHPIARLSRFSRNLGFSLLEAIVALALISLTGTAIFSWLNQSLSNLSTLNRHQAEAIKFDNALAYLKTVNPMQSPQGEVVLGDTTISWTSELVEEPARVVGKRGNPTTYAMALYVMNVRVVEANGRPVTFNMRQVGYLDER